ncbi:MAG: hypothetical protein K6E29_08670 [Cyanobacteria bacterium RUI128]|nr:hypothetical protein [Cyanobacteria bacterium RUI128]
MVLPQRMDGFVNNSTISPFEYGLKYSSKYQNYGVDKIRQNKESSNTQNQPKQLTNQPQPLGANMNNLIGSSLTDNMEIVVDTVTTPNQNTHQRLKTAAIIGGSAGVLGATALLLTRGKITKGLTSTLGKIADGAGKKIAELSEKPTISRAEGYYLSFLQKANKIAFMARGTLFNISPLKDVLFEKIVRNKLGLKKPCDAITSGFRRLSFGTVKSSYKKASHDINSMTKLFEETGAKHGFEPEVTQELNQGIERIRTAFDTHFSEPVLEKRSNALVKRFDGLGGRVYDSVYGRIKNFVTDVDEWTTFVSERLVAGDKKSIMKALADKKKIISNNPADNYQAMTSVLARLEKTVNPQHIDSRGLLRTLKGLSKEYISISGENESLARGKIVETINKKLDIAQKLATIESYTPEQTKTIEALIQEFRTVVNSDKKGEIELLLSKYKQLLPKEEYLKLKAAADKTVKSLNKAVYQEGFDYTDKIRDLSVGSALTDVAIGMALPIGTTSIAISAAKTKEKKRSVALKYGIPLIAGLATTTLCTVKLISGGRSLMLGGLVSIIGNELCERLDKHLLSKDAQKNENNS